MRSARRSPHGERGLKFDEPMAELQATGSLPSRGTWIEILCLQQPAADVQSLPSRGAWIEISSWSRTCSSASCRSPHGERGLKFQLGYPVRKLHMSLPSRGAWIEMFEMADIVLAIIVAPLTGSVD